MEYGFHGGYQQGNGGNNDELTDNEYIWTPDNGNAEGYGNDGAYSDYGGYSDYGAYGEYGGYGDGTGEIW